MSNDLVRAVPTFGNRTSLLPRGTAYAMSMDLELAHEGGTGKRFFLRTKDHDAAAGQVYHVFGRTSVLSAEGLIRELPSDLTLAYAAADLIRIQADESYAIEGEVLFDWRTTGMLRITFSGVVGLEGLEQGPAKIPPFQRPKAGSCFIATKHDTAVPSLRWLSQSQLFGVGTAQTGDDRLALSLDLYSAR